jgi:NAD+ dependent glucose-6-phosphate dehydrogenase
MKILLLGGLGVVGSILTPALSSKYDVLVSDIHNHPPNLTCQYLKIDISEFSQLIDKIPRDIDVIVNLAGLPIQEGLVGEEQVHFLTDVHIIGSYNVFLAAARLGVRKVIFASTNHVSGGYEENGHSALEREIEVDEYPVSDSAYAAMKLCAEQFGRLFSIHFQMSVICLRIGTVFANEYETLLPHHRARRTILSRIDTVDIFTKAIESSVQYGLYYAVSDNSGKPWSIQGAVHELGYAPTVNSDKILNWRSAQNLDV